MRRAPPRYAPLCLLWRVACLLIVGCGSSNSLSPVTQEQGVSACLTFASCVPGDGVHGCFTQQLSLFSTEEVRCLAAAGGDCGKASLCVGVSVSPAPADGGCSPSCDGPRLARCAENFRYQTSCSRWAAADATCLSTSLGAGCAIGSCPQTRAYCDGTRRIVCDSGLLVVHDCRLEGALTCQQNGGSATCVGSAGACAGAEGASRCDGDILVRCVGGREARNDCRIGFTGAGCRVKSVGSETTAFCGYNTECRPKSGDEACSGDGLKLTFCAAGNTRTVDCVGLGFRGCAGRACAPRL